MRRLPFFTPVALGAALGTALVIAGVWWISGGAIVSPGPLGAHTGDGARRGGVTAHVELSRRCSACHPAPWSAAIMSDRCLACHDEIRAELAGQGALHAHFRATRSCLACHTEHRGPDGALTRIDVAGFPHDATGFSLAAHQRTGDGRPFACADCHDQGLTRWDERRCEGCHRDLAPALMTAHVEAWGADCRACHDGVDRFSAPFDHARTRLPLTGKHAGVECRECHRDVRRADGFADAPDRCVGCHPMPDDHDQVFGDDCGACHRTDTWEGARFRHRFPLDHGEGGEVPCRTCHPVDYRTYTCYGCHEHTVARIERKHRKEGIADFRDCARCHPTGREDEAEDD